MAHDLDSRKIVAAVVGLGQSLGLPTVAEGVEELGQAEVVARLGCDIGQGWLFGHPVPAEAVAALMVARARGSVPAGVAVGTRGVLCSSDRRPAVPRPGRHPPSGATDPRLSYASGEQV